MKMNFPYLVWAGLVLGAVLAGGCRTVSPGPMAVLPVPQKLEETGGAFRLKAGTAIVTDVASRDTADYLAQRLRRSTGYSIPVRVEDAGQVAAGTIRLKLEAAVLGAEGYRLTATRRSVAIEGADAAGVFYGVQTLLELLPPEIFSAKVTEAAWVVPAVRIEDQPRFPWRGLLLDVARHFFTKEEVKRYIDLMALEKLNRLQLHLTDDQGWRVPIAKHPRLISVGAWRKDIGFGLDPKSSTAYGPDGRYGGFYTPEDIRELVAYAQARFVTIVPEIEMPGHAGAALSAMPQLGCSGAGYPTEAGPGAFAGFFCPGNEATYAFIQDVLGEVMDLFPGKYIHIGGDEVAKDNWKKCEKCQALIKREGLKNEQELQSYFIRRVENMVNARGRDMVGWSEIREGGLAQNAVLMDWIGGALESASTGHDVVQSPTTHCYFDYYQSQDPNQEPRGIGGFIPLDKVYSFEPMPAKLAPELQHHILGVQGNLWTEYIASLKHVEYMVYPRACALAEVGWSSAADRNWEDFKRRLQVHLQRLDQLGVNYRKGIPEPMSR